MRHARRRPGDIPVSRGPYRRASETEAVARQFAQAPEYTAAEDAMLVEMRDTDRATWKVIQARINALGTQTRSVPSLRVRYDKIVSARQRADAVRVQFPHGKNRTCMTCSAPFFSEHRGNRMCDPCRDGVSRGGPDLAPPSLGGTPEIVLGRMGNRVEQAAERPVDRILDGMNLPRALS